MSKTLTPSNAPSVLGRGCVVVTGGPRAERSRGSDGGIPGSNQDVVPDRDVALVPVAERPGDLRGVVWVRDVGDPEPIPVPEEGFLPPKAMSVLMSFVGAAGSATLAG
jgi:hypothetical protein